MQSVVVMLEELAQILQGLSLIKEVSPRLKARVCAYGEKMSTSLAVEILRKAGLAASLLDSKEVSCRQGVVRACRSRSEKFPVLTPLFSPVLGHRSRINGRRGQVPQCDRDPEE